MSTNICNFDYYQFCILRAIFEKFDFPYHVSGIKWVFHCDQNNESKKCMILTLLSTYKLYYLYNNVACYDDEKNIYYDQIIDIKNDSYKTILYKILVNAYPCELIADHEKCDVDDLHALFSIFFKLHDLNAKSCLIFEILRMNNNNKMDELKSLYCKHATESEVTLLNLFDNIDNMNYQDLKKLLSKFILDNFNVKLFGSIVYDPDNADDIDILLNDNYSKYEIVNTLSSFFRISHKTNIVPSLSKISEGDLNDFNMKLYCDKLSISSYDLYINNDFLTKIDMVDSKYFGIRLKYRDYIETSLQLTKTGICMSYSSTKTIDECLKSIRNKIITPCIFDITCSDDVREMYRHWMRYQKKCMKGFKMNGSIVGEKYMCFDYKNIISSIDVIIPVLDISHYIMQFLNTYKRNEKCCICNIIVEPDVIMFRTKINDIDLLCHVSCLIKNNNFKPYGNIISYMNKQWHDDYFILEQEE